MGALRGDFEQHFSELSDTALAQVQRADLVPGAQAAYDLEMDRRGISGEVAPEAPVQELSGGEELVNVVEFESAADAEEAQRQLKKNGIPAYIAVAVPAAFARQAVSLLDPGVSDEELAAQAERFKPGK